MTFVTAQALSEIRSFEWKLQCKYLPGGDGEQKQVTFCHYTN